MSASAAWLLGLGLLSFAAFLYPYLAYPLILRTLPSARPSGMPRRNTQRSAALLFCAYNEEASLPDKIANVRQLKRDQPDLQVLAYSDASSDGTNGILNDAADVLTPVFGRKRVGKVAGMRQLVGQTDADVLVFTDANVLVAPDALARLLARFDDPEIGSVGGKLLYTDRGDGQTTPTERTGGLYWRLEEAIKAEESRSGSMMGADGSLFACRRNSYPHIPNDLVDDLAASIHVLFDGKRCISAPDVVATEHGVKDAAEEFQRKRRIACGSYATYRHLAPQLSTLPALDRFKFISHKLMRWWGLFFLIGAWLALGTAALLSGFGTWWAGATGLAVVLGMVGARLQLPVLAEITQALLGVIATGIGVLESRFGRQYAVWEPASTR